MRGIVGGFVGCGVLAVMLAGCASEELPEGTQAGDCEDGADNDINGYFDCQDRGCWGAPACADAGNPQDTDDGSGNKDDGTDEVEDTDDTDGPIIDARAVAGHLRSFALTYQVSFVFDSLGIATCEGYFDTSTGVCDCTATYQAAGTLQEAESVRNMYLGTFELVETNCASVPDTADHAYAGMTINDAAIFRPDSGASHHTFRFNQELTKLSQWIAHEYPEDDTTTLTPFDNSQWWMKLTVQARNRYDADKLSVDYEENEDLMIEIISFKVTHHVIFQFSEDATPPAYPSLAPPE